MLSVIFGDEDVGEIEREKDEDEGLSKGERRM